MAGRREAFWNKQIAEACFRSVTTIVRLSPSPPNSDITQTTTPSLSPLKLPEPSATLPSQPLELRQCRSSPVYRPVQNAPTLHIVSKTKDDPEYSGDDESWLEPDPHAHGLALAQQTKRSIAAGSGVTLGYCLPPRFVPDPLISGVTVRFIMSQYEPLFELLFFKPIQVQMEFIRGRFISRITSSSVTHWSMYLGARIFQTLNRDGDHANIRMYIPWLNRFDELCVTSRNDSSVDDMLGRLSGAMELSFLMYITTNANNGYNFLRRMSPTFMQIAFADPLLWPRHPSSNGISLAHALVSSQYELGRFIFSDAVTSLTFGTTPLIEYDTSHPVIRAREAHPMEWVHGCPVELLFLVVKINSWRARDQDGLEKPGADWKEIETAAWAWRSAYTYAPDRDSWRTVARFAMQEAWRHAVLIYLYLARLQRACGVNTHDPRVQSSARQIIRLQTVTKSVVGGIGTHVFVPVLLVSTPLYVLEMKQIVIASAKLSHALATTKHAY
ncbi:hypothetical protein FRC09_000198 [Ceratobasidium sp. 395]|nr:hypothetical protein FRC09_000198 [Ceratobasidium sp. 395]